MKKAPFGWKMEAEEFLLKYCALLSKVMAIFTKYWLFGSLIIFILLTEIKTILVGRMDLK